MGDPDDTDPFAPDGVLAQAQALRDRIAEDAEEEERNEQARLAGLVALLRAQAETNRTKARLFKYNNERVTWPVLVEKLQHDKTWNGTFRMSLEAFNDLVDTLGDRIEMNVIKSFNSMPDSNNRIFPELVVAVGLRFLCGGRAYDIRLWAGISVSSVYRIRDAFLDAIIGTEALAVQWPDTPEMCWSLAQKFKNLSSHGVMDKVVGALDGILIPIRQPSDVDNPRAFFSGHYKRHGVNVQVVCDANLRVLYYSILGSGNMSDTLAYNCSTLPAKVEALPLSFIVLADNGYQPTEKLITPYCGADGRNPDNETFNFYLSQLRIRIEMCFGLLTAKWRILREDQEGSIRTITKVIEACLRLHNFVLDSVAVSDNVLFEEMSDGEVRAYISRVSRGLPDQEILEPDEPIRGASQTRDLLRDFIKGRGYTRPGHNIERRERQI